MPKTIVEVFKGWFNNELSDEQKRELVDFLYGGKGYLRKGVYAGPIPGLVTEGVHCGPVPQLAVTSCPMCGRSY